MSGVVELIGTLVPDGVLVVGDGGVLTYVNERGAAMIGLRPDDLVGRNVADYVHPDDLQLAFASLITVIGKRWGTPVELRVRAPGGSWRLVEMVGRDCTGVEGVDGVVVTVRDLTERRMWEVAASDVVMFQHVVQHARAIVMAVALDGRVASVNGAFIRMLGHDPSVVVGALLSDFVVAADKAALAHAFVEARADGEAAVEVAMRHALDVEPVMVRFEVVDAVNDPVLGSFVVTGHDIRDLAAARRHLERLATHDPLTGLANRGLLQSRLEHLLAEGQPLAVCFVDLDGFKAVNDTHGHEAGDELLVHVAHRLTQGVADGDLVARLGGDEFVVVCPGVEGAADAERVAGRLAAALGAPYSLGVAAGRTVALTASVGAVVAEPGATAASLVSLADRAMYAVKAASA